MKEEGKVYTCGAFPSSQAKVTTSCSQCSQHLNVHSRSVPISLQLLSALSHVNTLFLGCTCVFRKVAPQESWDHEIGIEIKCVHPCPELTNCATSKCSMCLGLFLLICTLLSSFFICFSPILLIILATGFLEGNRSSHCLFSNKYSEATS